MTLDTPALFLPAADETQIEKMTMPAD